MTQLILSLFPGVGLLDSAFEQEGFCVVRGPDVLWGGDIRRFHSPAGRFDGVIGGPPCQAFSSLSHIVRHNGHEPKFGNLIPEFERVASEALPAWFLMENVPRAPLPCVDGYATDSFLLDNNWLGEERGRLRRWSFGVRGPAIIKISPEIKALWPERRAAVVGGHSGTLSRIDKRRVGKPNSVREYRTGTSCIGMNSKSGWAFSDIKKGQGLPEDYDLPGFTIEGKCKAVGNGVPLAMGRAIARAVREVFSHE